MRRAVGGAALLLAAGGLVWWGRPDAAPTLPPRPAPMGLPAPERADAPPSEPREAPEPAPQAPVALRALQRVAEAAGEGWVACQLPADAPDGVPRGLGRGVRQGDTLVARVVDPSGVVALRAAVPDPPPGADDEALAAVLALRDAPPFAVARWAGAWPGEEGTCTVEPVRWAWVEGRVAFVHGPVDGRVHGCGGSHAVEADGRFAFEAVEGPPCALSFRDRGLGGEVWVVPGSGRFVTLPEGSPDDDAMRLDALRAELAALQAAADPVDRALEQGVDADEAALLRRWQADERAERAVRIEALARMVAYLGDEEGRP